MSIKLVNQYPKGNVSISIIYNVGEIIGALLVDGGVSIAGAAYAVTVFDRRNRE